MLKERSQVPMYHMCLEIQSSTGWTSTKLKAHHHQAAILLQFVKNLLNLVSLLLLSLQHCAGLGRGLDAESGGGHEEEGVVSAHDIAGEDQREHRQGQDLGGAESSAARAAPLCKHGSLLPAAAPAGVPTLSKHLHLYYG